MGYRLARGRPGGNETDTRISSGPDGLLLEEESSPSARLWTLDHDRLTIGRDPTAQVYLDDPEVSRRHADLVHQGSTWVIVDDGSTNGTYVNNVRVHDAALHPGDRICVGRTFLVVKPVTPTPPSATGAHYDVGAQYGTISNVAGNQSIVLQESNLRYVASLRGRARHLITTGIALFFVGQAVGLFGVLLFQANIFNSFNEPAFDQPDIPPAFFISVAAGSVMSLVGLALFIFGLIARSGAKREAYRRGVNWP